MAPFEGITNRCNAEYEGTIRDQRPLRFYSEKLATAKSEFCEVSWRCALRSVFAAVSGNTMRPSSRVRLQFSYNGNEDN